MADSSVKITISAEDQASATLNRVKQAFDEYQKSYETIGQYTARLKSESDALASSQQNLAKSADQATSANKGLFTTFVAAELSVSAVKTAVRYVTDEVQASIQAANQYQSAMAGLSSYASAFGQSASGARDAVKTLSSDGLVPVTSNATALKDLLSSGLNLQQAVTLMDAFKDRAAFGRDSSLSYGQAVENLAQSFKTEQSRLGDLSGMTENYSQILQVGADQMGKSVKQLSEAERAQAKYLGILQLSTAATGDAGRYAETAAGQQAHMAYQVNQTQIAMGTALQPSLIILQQSLVSLANSFTGTDAGMKIMQADLATLATFVAETVQAAYDQQIRTIANGTADAQINSNNRSLNTMSDATKKAMKQMATDIAKENQSFTDGVAKRTQQFQDSLRDMIIAHRDKSRSLQQDIADENTAYADQVLQRKEQLTDQLNGLEDTHQQKVADITQKITDERARGIYVDGILYSEGDKKKIENLEASLAKEDAAYQKSVDKAQDKYNEDVANDQKRHDAKLATLQTSLTAEMAILQKNAVDVAAVGNAVAMSDIDRLRRSYAEQNTESAKQHAQRLADIRQRGADQGVAYGNAMAGGIAGTLPAVNGALDMVKNSMVDSANNAGKSSSDAVWNSFKSGIKTQFA